MIPYTKEEIYNQAKDQVEGNNLFSVEDILAFLPIGKTKFYALFPFDSDELNALKGLLDINKIKTKSGIRAKLYNSDKAAELLALYRLIATPEEHQKLNQSYIDHSSKGEKIQSIPAIHWVKDANGDKDK